MSVTQLGDATLSLSTYLVRRANTYYFRARIPADIAVATGRSQIVVSLRTTELRIAKVAAARVCVSLSTICGTIRSMADDVFTDRIDGLTKAQRLASAAFAMGQDYEIQRAKLRAHFDLQLRLLAASIPDDDCKLTVPAMPLGEIGDATLLELFQLPPNTATRRELQEHSDRIDCVVASPPYEWMPDVNRPTVPKAAPMVTEKPSPGWPKLIAEYFADKPGLRPKTLWSYNQAFRDFEKLIGDKPIADITRSDVKRYANHLRDRDNPRGGKLDRQTIIKSLGHIKTFLEWAVANKWVADDGFEHVKPRDMTQAEKLEEDSRRPFTLDELTKLFHTRLVQLPKNRKELCSRWFLLAALLTGGRTDELACAPSRLIDLGGFHCLDLRAASKTSAAPRLVPVCLELERLGFVAFAEEQSKKGYLLFQDSRSPKTAGAWSHALNRLIDKEISDDPDLTLYSLRHNFRQSQRAANLNDELSNKIFGHSSGKVGEGYGKNLSEGEAALFVRSIRSPVHLDFLIQS